MALAMLTMCPWCRSWRLLLFAVCFGVAAQPNKGGGQEPQQRLNEKVKLLKGTVKMMWPIQVSRMMLSSNRKEKQAFEKEEFGRDLARIGLEGYERYMSETLPRELEADPTFAANYQKADHSRANLAFKRWQTRAFASWAKLPIKRVSFQGEIAPQLAGINYSWPELYESRRFSRFQSLLKRCARLYLQQFGYSDEELNQKFVIFPWVEVFGFGEALRPMSRSDGAYIFGRYFAHAAQTLMKFNFEDTRGINPPYGKTFSTSVEEGQVFLLPAWVSTFTTPVMKNETHVAYSFLVYPENGKLRHDEDLTAGFIGNRDWQVKIA